MQHMNSVFHQITKRIPWSVFDKAVEESQADHRVRKLRTRDQFLALLYGQLSGAVSLREIEHGLKSHQNRLYHSGARTISRSTLADANARRPNSIYADVFKALLAQAGSGLRRKLRGKIRLIDATRIALSSHSKSWIPRIQDHHAGKVHVVYDPISNLPLHADITAQNVNDITPARALDIEPNATYVFDLGYYSYDWWAKLHDLDCRFVTRLKTHTHLSDVQETLLTTETRTIRLDQTGVLNRQLKGRKNPLTARVREIHVVRDDGRILRLVTNDLKAPAQEIANLYKLRWEIELFFKWLKQNLRIKHFIGRGENAVKTQVYIALIAFLLLRSVHSQQKVITKLQAFTRLIRLNIMHRKPVNRLIQSPDDPPDIFGKQLSMDLVPC